MKNLEILNNSTDARGRKLEVVKVHCPPPLFRTYKEAAGVDVRTLPFPSLAPCPFIPHRVPGACIPACMHNGMPSGSSLLQSRHKSSTMSEERIMLQAMHKWQYEGTQLRAAVLFRPVMSFASLPS